MTGSIHRSLALAAATQRDLLRRPGAVLAVAGVIVLLLLLPRFAARALDDHGALATELAVSTTGLALSILAGFAGLLASATGSPIGPAAELATSPLRWTEYVLGRFAGIVVACVVVLLVLSLSAAAGTSLVGGVAAPDVGLLLLTSGGVLLQAALFAAVGALLGAALPVPSASVLLLAFLVASRLVIPGLLDSAAAPLGYLLPDPTRLDLSRELGFARPIATESALLAWASAVAQISALLAASSMVLERRQR